MAAERGTTEGGGRHTGEPQADPRALARGLLLEAIEDIAQAAGLLDPDELSAALREHIDGLKRLAAHLDDSSG